VKLFPSPCGRRFQLYYQRHQSWTYTEVPRLEKKTMLLLWDFCKKVHTLYFLYGSCYEIQFFYLRDSMSSLTLAHNLTWYCFFSMYEGNLNYCSCCFLVYCSCFVTAIQWYVVSSHTYYNLSELVRNRVAIHHNHYSHHHWNSCSIENLIISTCQVEEPWKD